ncbi:BRCA1-associated ATM activator 1-like [Lingula anatina]|uniref:BRCA1-associated ATM activator 1-like n=1 Tax=Lingula anatina TaxID=7574 RepID=A0A1S3I4W7_LINAN|nr:BRCA1-associated ATM activator 1-like [Lingula anatina]|eukprot:XP_013393268.1 BRCA1-associated ATM activator 1-like [Lingula anatina]
MLEFTKLNKVLDLLLDPNFVLKDDTFEQKILDIFLKKCNPGQTQGEEIPKMVVRCLQSLVKMETPANIGLFTQIMGCIGATDTGFRALMEHGLVGGTLKIAHQADAWNEPSTRYAVFHALAIMANHSNACRWILEQGYVELCFNSFQDGSVFVASAARRLLSQLTQWSYQKQSTHQVTQGANGLGDTPHREEYTIGNHFSDGQKTICNFIKENFAVGNLHNNSEKELSNTNSHLPLHYLVFLETLCDKSPVTCLSLIKDCCLLPLVCQSLRSRDRPASLGAVRLLSRLMPVGLFDDADSNSLILNEPKQLMCEGNPHVAIKLCEAIVINKRDEPFPDLLQINLLPVLVVSGRSPPEDVAQYGPQTHLLMTNHTALSKLFCASLQVLQNLLQQGITVDCFEALVSCLQEAVSLQSQVSTTGHLVLSTDRVMVSLLKTVKTCCCQSYLQDNDVSKFSCGQIEIASHLTKLLEDTTSSVTVAVTCLQCLSCCLGSVFSVYPGQLPCWAEFSERLGHLLQRLLCDMRWEVRDSALEMIGQLPNHSTDPCSVCSWITQHDLHVLTWSSIKDGESYVRASGLRAVSSLSAHHVLWEDLLAKSNLQMDAVVQDVLSLLETDSEAFPRRAAVQVLSSWYSIAPETTQAVILVSMTTAIKDFDWEVQVLVLAFWESVFTKCFQNVDTPAYAVVAPSQSKQRKREFSLEARELDIMNRCCEILLFAVKDCDRKVCEKAAKMIAEIMPELQSKCQNIADGTYSVVEGECKKDKVNCLMESVKELRTVDVPEILHEKSQSSDGYAENPFSILDDILASCEEPDEGAVIDCY